MSSELRGDCLICFKPRVECRRIPETDTRPAHTDTCNGDHSDVNGRCESDPEE